MTEYVLAGVAGAAVGALLVWLALRGGSAALRQQAETLQQQVQAMSAELAAARGELQRVTGEAAKLDGELSQLRPALEAARDEAVRERELRSTAEKALAGLRADLEAERKNAGEKLALLQDAQAALEKSFHGLAANALRQNNDDFLKLAQQKLQTFQQQGASDLEARQKAVETLVSPLKESLEKVDAQIRTLESQRSQAYGDIKQNLLTVTQAQEQLRGETQKLVQALKAPSVRGRWGEIQLRRVVEMAGMLSYCDFVEQETVEGDGKRLRPDLIVKLPGGKQVVVDAKTPLGSYLEAVESTDDKARAAHMAGHARQVREHMRQLSGKGYWDQFDSTPEFVVMFLPGEMFFSAALEQDPGLIEEGVAQKVIPASPTTLIALLRAVAYGWKQEQIARNAQQISDLGKELHDRLVVLAGHMQRVGKSLDGSVEAYNRAVGSFESRVLVSARKFEELGAATDELPMLDPIETTARNLQLFDENHEGAPE